ncbi:uncharacterized protein MYCFIDRAFT_176907 [Pseudocercospora fijiensis CIRAD86]|uniref:Uncharacterized protein n=1 Tax=Pseudocercospora fijiensis (strain CIRAD86) TaxID=383855 RepID=M3A5L5_PSEFD|nr:uncharacterized protein MYCFIDRAFT_176907 [Pseudocercospora fijiensis CIRAD86]EME79906.1 hypothetical protein MYCFIDRAFT_176907 [Pseudocercospora fijiensis CIRAD86]
MVILAKSSPDCIIWCGVLHQSVLSHFRQPPSPPSLLVHLHLHLHLHDHHPFAFYAQQHHVLAPTFNCWPWRLLNSLPSTLANSFGANILNHSLLPRTIFDDMCKKQDLGAFQFHAIALVLSHQRARSLALYSGNTPAVRISCTGKMSRQMLVAGRTATITPLDYRSAAADAILAPGCSPYPDTEVPCQNIMTVRRKRPRWYSTAHASDEVRLPPGDEHGVGKIMELCICRTGSMRLCLPSIVATTSLLTFLWLTGTGSWLRLTAFVSHNTRWCLHHWKHLDIHWSIRTLLICFTRCTRQWKVRLRPGDFLRHITAHIHPFGSSLHAQGGNERRLYYLVLPVINWNSWFDDNIRGTTVTACKWFERHINALNYRADSDLRSILGCRNMAPWWWVKWIRRPCRGQIGRYALTKNATSIGMGVRARQMLSRRNLSSSSHYWKCVVTVPVSPESLLHPIFQPYHPCNIARAVAAFLSLSTSHRPTSLPTTLRKAMPQHRGPSSADHCNTTICGSLTCHAAVEGYKSGTIVLSMSCQCFRQTSIPQCSLGRQQLRALRILACPINNTVIAVTYDIHGHHKYVVFTANEASQSSASFVLSSSSDLQTSTGKGPSPLALAFARSLQPAWWPLPPHFTLPDLLHPTSSTCTSSNICSIVPESTHSRSSTLRRCRHPVTNPESVPTGNLVSAFSPAKHAWTESILDTLCLATANMKACGATYGTSKQGPNVSKILSRGGRRIPLTSASLGQGRDTRTGPTSGLGSVLDTWGREVLPSTYPYARELTELDSVSGFDVSRNGDQSNQQNSRAPRPPPRRRTSSATQYVNPGPSDRRMDSSQQITYRIHNSAQRRRPLRSITGTSAHNSRNSRSTSNEDVGESTDFVEETERPLLVLLAGHPHISLVHTTWTSFSLVLIVLAPVRKPRAKKQRETSQPSRNAPKTATHESSTTTRTSQELFSPRSQDAHLSSFLAPPAIQPSTSLLSASSHFSKSAASPPVVLQRLDSQLMLSPG